MQHLQVIQIKIQRDHGGPEQGQYSDDGYESFREDCKYFDLIHVDPWKKYQDLNEGIKWTIDIINFCYNINPNIEYEIGTEEAIRPYSCEELEIIITELKNNLEEKVFNKIKYCVVQCGNKLSTCENIGIFDEDKLKQMICLCKKYNLISKEHNGDWVELDIIKHKEKLGLEFINIAPELGEIESRVLLNNFKNNIEDYKNFFRICLDSNKWKKWVNNDFDPYQNKDKLILITGHYIYSNEDFLKIKEKYLNIDNKIKVELNNKLSKIYFKL